jgi:OOP family OmpA-OmpF porin
MYDNAQRALNPVARMTDQPGVTLMTATRTLFIAAIASAFLPGISLAQAWMQDSKNQGYLVDSYGNSITTSSNTGLCWRDSDWTPARSVEPCDPVARKAQAPSPRVVAAAPAPQKRAPAPARMAPRRVNFSADTLFDFDKSALKPEGRTALDGFGRQLEGAQYEVLFVTGHTDRFGSNEYNQRLSERRAQTVKAYLMSRNIGAERIAAEGKGETQPVTQAGDCLGARSAKVVACLQPDRRVHVEVTGNQGVTTSSR